MNSVIYSEPFKIENNFEHQYRITLVDDNVEIDHVKCTDMDDDLNEDFGIQLIKNLVNINLIEMTELVKNNIDFRDNKVIDNKNKTQEEQMCLDTITELYQYLKDNILN